MIPKIFIIKQKPNISKISAATLKELGFKSKAIAKNFAKLSDVNPKDFRIFIAPSPHKGTQL